MRQARRLSSRGDVDTYISDLEDVYGIDIDMKVIPIISDPSKPMARLELKGYWKGDDWSTGPMAYHVDIIRTEPDTKYIATMIHALIHFTYQCVEAHVSALPPRD